MSNPYKITSPEGKVVSVRNIYCIGRNYLDHIQELNNEKPDAPFYFQKSLSTLNTTDIIQLPKDREIHHELEITVLINKDGESIPSEDAGLYIGGYGLGLDLTDRSLQNELKEKQLPWLLAKSFKGSAVITEFQMEEITDPFWLTINGEKRQGGEVTQMIHAIPDQIAYLSNMIPLMKGDILFTGTPKGVGPIQSGDALEMGIGDQSVKRLTVQ